MEHTLNPIIERHAPEAPQRKYRGFKPKPKVNYNFGVIEVGMAARFSRNHTTVRERMYEYLKTPEGKGKKFIVRAITPTMCRIWRTK